jgi:predicted RNA-binding Zn-ribbon protein involved in translation (DUF1610 family)
MPNSPILPANTHSDRTWITFPCPYCGERHIHGAGPGHRIAHCGTLPADIDCRAGYVLVHTDEPPPPAPKSSPGRPNQYDWDRILKPYRIFGFWTGQPERRPVRTPFFICSPQSARVAAHREIKRRGLSLTPSVVLLDEEERLKIIADAGLHPSEQVSNYGLLICPK